MVEGTKIFGFLGTGLVIIAYVPQIHHLIKERCSAGISIRAYAMWFASGIFILIHAVSIQSPVFIVLQSYQLVATGLIVFFGKRYENSACEIHRH